MKKSFLMAFLWTFPCLGVVPPHLTDLEKNFWKERALSSPVKKETGKVIEKIYNPLKIMGPREAVDLSPLKKWEIVKHFDYIQEQKLKARVKFPAPAGLPAFPGIPQRTYITSYDKHGNGDPFPEIMKYKGHIFQLSLNYDGAPITKQPGNLYFEELGRFPITYDFADGVRFDQPDVHLLLLAEISRRHAVDPSRAGDERLLKGLDEHNKLPVALGLAMAAKLIDGNHIFLSDFWRNGEIYHLYTGPVRDREDAFVALHDFYRQTYMGDLPDEDQQKEHLLSLMKQYFEVPEEEDLTDVLKLFDETKFFNGTL